VFLRTIIFLFLLCPAVISAESVNLRLAHPIGGGAGDVAANLWMAQLLRKLDPSLDIRLVLKGPRKVSYAYNAFDKLPLLISDFDKDQDENAWDGFTIYQGSFNDADWLLSFSTSLGLLEEDLPSFIKELENPKANPHSLLETSDKFIFIKEHNAIGQEQLSGVSPKTIPFVANDKEKRFAYLMSGVSHSGIYTSSLEPSAPMTKVELKKLLLEKLPAIEEWDPYNENHRFAFLYASKDDSVEAYLKIFLKYSHMQDSDNQFYILVNREPKLTYELPENVHLIKYGSIDFLITQAAIFHSDLPILVTGDISLDIAIEFQKVFFYEARNWKIPHIDDLVSKLLSSQKFSPNEARLMREMVFKFPSVWTDEDPGLVVAEDRLARVFADQDFQTKFIASLALLKARHSLPEFVVNAIKENSVCKKTLQALLPTQNY